MLAPTHGVFGIFLTLIILAVFGIQQSLHWSILLCAIIGSLSPDIDHPKALIGRVFFFISKPLDRHFGHRTITHSLLGWLICTLLFALSLFLVWHLYLLLASTSLGQNLPFHADWDRPFTTGLVKRWIAAFSIGYLSHIILDMFNPRGSQLFWPNPGRDVIPGNPEFRPESGSQSEIFIFFLLFGLMTLSFPLSKHGITTSLHWLLATPESAIEEFKALTTKAYVDCDGILNATHTPFVGEAEILTVKNGKLIVYITENQSIPSGVYTLSDELAADITAKQVRVKKTQIPIVTTRKQFKNETKDDLLANLPKTALVSGTIYLPKDMKITIRDAQSSYKTIDQVGDELRLSFATEADLQALAWDDAFTTMRRQDALTLQKLSRQIQRTKRDILAISDPKGLTKRGQDALLTDEERQLTAQKREILQAQLEEFKLEEETLIAKMNTHNLTFSGDVTLYQ